MKGLTQCWLNACSVELFVYILNAFAVQKIFESRKKNTLKYSKFMSSNGGFFLKIITSIAVLSFLIFVVEKKLGIEFSRLTYVFIQIVQGLSLLPVYPLEVVGRSSESQLQVGKK